MIEYFFGDDTFTARKKIQEKAAALSASIRFIDPEEAGAASVESLFDSANPSLFGAMFVVIENPSQLSEEVRDSILATCERSFSGNVVLWDKSVDKRLVFHKKIKQLVPSSEMSAPATEDGMVAWLSSYAPDISRPALRELVSRVGCDVWAAVSEIEKLRVLPSSVEVSDVVNLVAQRETSYSSAFPLLDAIVRRRQVDAIRILGEMFSGGASERFILAMLSYQFRLFLYIRVGKNNGDSVTTIHDKTGLHSIAIQKAMPAAAGLSVPTISEILRKIAATEKSLVTTTMDPRSIVTMLIIGLCR